MPAQDFFAMLRRWMPAVAFAIASMPAPAASVDLPLANGPTITAHWLPAPAAGRRPVIVALHGCSGLYQRDGSTFDPRYAEYFDIFNRAGWHVLLPDSFSARGYKSVCAIPRGQPTVSAPDRRDDVAAAVGWLAARPEVDASRIAVVGWSHGAMATLHAINSASPGFTRGLAGAAVFYPGCNAVLRGTFAIDMPLVMLLGEKDDWTPAAPCLQLAERTRRQQPDALFVSIVYPDSHHGFDSARPVRFRSDVANGKGAHVGGNPAAREAARKALMEFLTKVLQ